MQEEVPDARRLDPGDVGCGAGEDAGLVLYGAADGAEAHHAVDLPTVPALLAQQRTTRVALSQRHGGAFKSRKTAPTFDITLTSSLMLSLTLGPDLACSRWILLVPEPSTDHGVSHAVAPEFLLSARLEVNDGQARLIEGFCQRYILLST